MATALERIIHASAVLSVLAAVGYSGVLPLLGGATRQIELAIHVPNVARGENLLRQGGCVVCHTDAAKGGAFLAGGAQLRTPFGVFYGPNITPDPEQGIGGMSLQQFFDAMTAGKSPTGEHYYPSFPYTSYGQLTVADVVDLKAYLDTVPPIAAPSKPHELAWPFSDRNFLGVWKQINHVPRPFREDPTRSAAWNRGAYLVNGPGHCGECHSARSLMGGVAGRPLAGSGGDGFGSGAPALVGRKSTIRDWTEDDLIFYFQVGLTPSGDVSGGKMIDVIEQGVSHLSDDDLSAIAAYLLAESGAAPSGAGVSSR